MKGLVLDMYNIHKYYIYTYIHGFIHVYVYVSYNTSAHTNKIYWSSVSNMVALKIWKPLL